MEPEASRHRFVTCKIRGAFAKGEAGPLADEELLFGQFLQIGHTFRTLFSLLTFFAFLPIHKRALLPLRLKKNDGFQRSQTLRNFSGFFHPRLVGLVARGS